MAALWILVPIAIIIIAIVVAFPLWFTHRRMRNDHDLESAEQYLNQIGKSHDDAAFGRPAPPKEERDAARRAREAGGPEDTGEASNWSDAAPRGRHAAPETAPQPDESLPRSGGLG
ncbi:MAG TPA: hypothetical protein VF843_15645 [Streptosporangiaceae bacterium]